jgi:hypothetical protein
MNSSIKPIGGYFELELRKLTEHLYPSALKFQSARTAFYALLEAGKPKHIWMPKYICNSMLLPIYALNIDIIFYDLTSQLGVSDSVSIAENDWILFVNYFGICTKQESELLTRFNPGQIIFDHSQAFYVSPVDCLATIYSPRKFFGVPDGGYLVTNIKIAEPQYFDTASASRCTHLLQRLDGDITSGYESFKNAEASLNDCWPRKMSTLTNQMLSSLDYELIKSTRKTNFTFLHHHLKDINGLELSLESIDSPMCYPLFLDDATEMRLKLIENKVFVSTYWNEVKERVNHGSLEHKLVENCLPIPCDQRYEKKDLMFILKLISKEKNA